MNFKISKVREYCDPFIRPVTGAVDRPETMIEFLDALGDAHARITEHKAAAAYHRAALHQKQLATWPPVKMVASYSALATDATNLFQLDEALDWVRQAQALPLPKAGLAILYQQEARILECKDDYISALHVFEHSLKLQDANVDVPQVLQHMDFLKQVLVSSQDMPTEVASAIRSRIKDMSKGLIRNGYGSEGQFPKRYVPRLRSEPWHTLEEAKEAGELGTPSWMEQAYTATRAAKAELLEEYQALKDAGKMIREQECIHSHRGGQWSRFEINALWHRTDSGGIRCAVESPRACSLFRKLQGVGMPLIRAGYSSVSAGAWLKPHYGTTNAQLKLSVPASPQKECATLRVANVTHAWEDGKLLFFDDSFEHEVFNHCDQERVVFQLVFAHPDLGTGEEAIKCATGEAPCTERELTSIDLEFVKAASIAVAKLAVCAEGLAVMQFIRKGVLFVLFNNTLQSWALIGGTMAVLKLMASRLRRRCSMCDTLTSVTEVVGSGVEAVINFFKDRGPKLLVQQDGVSLVNEEAEAPGKPVTHCWVQCLGLPFLPVLQYIAFLNGDEIVTDWRA
eukprot:s1615_g9.t1